MKSRDLHTTLSSALGETGPQVVALVGAGGKTSALHLLVEELAASRGSVLATTTTMMLASQLSLLGPLLFETDDALPLLTRAAASLRDAETVSLAHSRASDGKVKGLSPAAVDSVWAAGLTPAMVVEADGSRGLPLKAFGATEPQLPSRTTVAVVLAGLDAIGLPLDEDHVHRAALLKRLLGAAPDSVVTPELIGAALALQVARVRASLPGARVIVLLNKADDETRRGQGALASASLLSSLDHDDSTRPDRIVVGSVRQRTFVVVYG